MRHLALTCFAVALASTSCASERGAGTGISDARNSSPEPGELADLPAEPHRTASSAFWDHWGDGRGELSGYTGQISRYGELRDATVVLVYVTEPMDRRVWIKDQQAPDDQRVNVLKLNHVAKFQTGIYPYSVTTSVFAPVDDWKKTRARFQPTKISLGTQEWCGNFFEAIWPGPARFLSAMHSYFAGEGDRSAVVDTPDDTLYEDALFIQLRELDGPFAGGQDWKGHLVPRLWERRKAHAKLEAVPATITRADATLDGRAVTRFVLTYGERKVAYDVEKKRPRRILRWERSDGTHFQLADTARLPYWKLHNPGDEHYRKQIGLEPTR